jgi:hypothetical protein
VRSSDRSRLPDVFHDVVTIAEAAAQEHRFFHWELEFPEVFYRARPGTVQIIERVQGAGFDAVVGNPPYDVISSEELGVDVTDILRYFESNERFADATVGKKNLYKLFVSQGLEICRTCGTTGFIVPMTLLGDEQSASIRRILLAGDASITFEVFPQKDDARRRVFPEAKLATTVFVRADDKASQLSIRVHDGREIDAKSPTLTIRSHELSLLDSRNLPIPPCTQDDWDLAIRILQEPGAVRLSTYCEAFQGEVNETSDGQRGFISYRAGDGPEVLRGANISMYALREASQGEPIYLRTELFRAAKADSVKTAHSLQRRVGWQETSPQNNFRRIIAAPIPEGSFCNHKINYVPERNCDIHLDSLVALLNSALMDWFFRLTSTNAQVGHYQILMLPVVPALVDLSETALRLRELSAEIQRLEGARHVGARTERSRLAPESAVLQAEADAVIFAAFGMSPTEASFVHTRLRSML